MRTGKKILGFQRTGKAVNRKGHSYFENDKDLESQKVSVGMRVKGRKQAKDAGIRLHIARLHVTKYGQITVHRYIKLYV